MKLRLRLAEKISAKGKAMGGPAYVKTPLEGRVAVVTNPGSRYFGEKVVIQRTTSSGKTLLARRVVASKPQERLIYSKGEVIGARARYESRRFDVVSLRLTSAKAAPYIKGWEKETCKFMDPYLGMTRTQVQKYFREA